MKIRFITTNPGKLEEARARLGPLGVEVEPFRAEFVEPQAEDLETVARAKAEQLLQSVAPPYFTEDAGLFVDALRGFPGVYSHYVFSTLGCDGVLRLLGDAPAAERSATFRAVIGYADAKKKIHLLAGEAKGSIVAAPRGDNGFGFDPIFQPMGHRRTFAELTASEKGTVSHRGAALDALAAFLGREANKKA